MRGAGELLQKRKLAIEASFLTVLDASSAEGSIVAEPSPAEPDARIWTTAVATPFTAIATLAIAIVAMPPASTALARAMSAMNLDKTGAQPLGHLAEARWGSTGNRRSRNQKGRCS